MSGLRLRQLTSNSATSTGTDRSLTVNNRGEVILGRYRVQILSAIDWSDKVFAPGYALRPLADVSRYVAVHQHLPGVPSAAEMVSEGIYAARLNAKLLEKVEELPLYLIAQQKEVVEQRRDIGRLQQRLTDLTSPKKH